MADESVAIAPAVGGGAGGGSDAGASSMPPASMSDTQFLNAPETAAVETKTPATEAAKVDAPVEEINLSALEEGQPEWLAKVTDPAVKAEVEKLLGYQKTFSEKFKDADDLAAFFKDLPGGREQVQSLQTLSKEVGELDSALEANEPDGLGPVVERYLSMTPDGGVNLLRSAAQHMAKTSPESWNQVSSELVNSTLRAAGIGADWQGMVAAIAEMRTAAQGEKWEDFGRAANKLLGQPQAEAKPDARLESLTARENAARASEQKAQSDSWTFRRDAGASKVSTHTRTEAGKVLAKVLPASIPEQDRTKLLNDIEQEVSSQVMANPWLNSQVNALIGQRVEDGKGGYTFGKAILTADQKAFDQATEMLIGAANGKLITAAVAKVVSEWSKTRASSNLDARNKAKGAATKVDVGGGKPAVNNGRKPVSVEQLQARNPDGSLKISDREFLNL